MLLRLSRRLGLALGAAVIMSLAVSGVASADVTHRFSAYSGDQCGYGYTYGHLTWSATLPAVGVDGAVVDHPADRLFPCRDDGRITVAHFIAYTVSTPVDRQAARADNSEQTFTFRLGANTSPSRITHVTVQVCRYSSSAAPDYCGETRTYRNPT